METQHFLQLFIRGESDLLQFEVKEEVCDRLQSILSEEQGGRLPPFFWFDSEDGRSVIVSIGDIQAVRYLWEAFRFPTEQHPDADSICIKIRDRPKAIKAFSEEFLRVAMFFQELEMGYARFPGFPDEDGEMLSVAASELVWASAPADLIAEQFIDEDEAPLELPKAKRQRKDPPVPARPPRNSSRTRVKVVPSRKSTS